MRMPTTQNLRSTVVIATCAVALAASAVVNPDYVCANGTTFVFCGDDSECSGGCDKLVCSESVNLCKYQSGGECDAIPWPNSGVTADYYQGTCKAPGPKETGCGCDTSGQPEKTIPVDGQCAT